MLPKNNTRTTSFKFIWDNAKSIPLFNNIPGISNVFNNKGINYKQNILIYSCFNYDASPLINETTNMIPTNTPDNNTLRIYYAGERFLDEVNSHVVVGFLPNNIYIVHPNKSILDNDKDNDDGYPNSGDSRDDIDVVFLANMENSQIETVTGLDIQTVSTHFPIMVVNVDGKPYDNKPSDIIDYDPLNRNKIVIQLREQERNQLEYWFRTRHIKCNILTDTKYLTKHYPIYGLINKRWAKELEVLTEKGLDAKPRFCCFIVSNPNCSQRNKFFELLQNASKEHNRGSSHGSRVIDSMGKYLRNMKADFVVPDRMNQEEYFNLIRKYRFMITFENNSLPHYQTEKIFNAYMSGTVPIYWGDPYISRMYNPDTFIHVETQSSVPEQFKTFQSAIDKIMYLENNPNEYIKLFNKIPVQRSLDEDRRVYDNIRILSSLGSCI